MKIFYKVVCTALVLGAMMITSSYAQESRAIALDPLAQLVTALQSGAPEKTHARCCKRCEKGKACGDSCISRKKTCQRGQGCACD